MLVKFWHLTCWLLWETLCHYKLKVKMNYILTIWSYHAKYYRIKFLALQNRILDDVIIWPVDPWGEHWTLVLAVCSHHNALKTTKMCKKANLGHKSKYVQVYNSTFCPKSCLFTSFCVTCQSNSQHTVLVLSLIHI